MFTFLFVAALGVANAQTNPTIYSCKEQKLAVFDWSEGGVISKAGLSGEIKGPSGEGSTVTLVISGKKAMFKGNNGESNLEVVDEVTFLERPPMGNVIMWKLIPAKDTVPALLVQFKGYSISGPYIHAWVFKCS